MHSTIVLHENLVVAFSRLLIVIRSRYFFFSFFQRNTHDRSEPSCVIPELELWEECPSSCEAGVSLDHVIMFGGNDVPVRTARLVLEVQNLVMFARFHFWVWSLDEPSCLL